VAPLRAVRAGLILFDAHSYPILSETLVLDSSEPLNTHTFNAHFGKESVSSVHLMYSEEHLNAVILITL